MNAPLINTFIHLRPDRLGNDLPTIQARQLHSVNVMLRDVPTDVTSVVLRVYKTDLSTHFDIPVSMRADGSSGFAYVIGTCFPDTGTAFYEVHAYDYKGNCTALGRGPITIGAFGQTGAAVTAGASVPVTQVTDADGGLHTISAVSDGDSGWTLVLDA